MDKLGLTILGLLIILSCAAEPIDVSVTDEDREIGKYDDGVGHLIFGKSEPLTFLKRTGPFIRLADGSIFSSTIGGATCGISRDGGFTWTEYPLFDPAKFELYSPVSVQTRTGTIILGFTNGKEQHALNWNKTTHCYDAGARLPTYVICSRDNGQTWSEPLKLHDEWTGMNRELIETREGYIIFSTMTMRNNPGRHCVFTYVSADDGVTWAPSNILDNPTSAGDHGGLMEATLTELKNGKLWMLIRTNWDYFYESCSSNHGLTWSNFKKTSIDASSSPGALTRLQSGRIVLVWNRLYYKGESSITRQGGDGNLSEVAASWQRGELSLMYSDDEGKTWSESIIIAENAKRSADAWASAKWIAYPHIFEAAPGVIWITTGYGNLKIKIAEKDM